MAKQNNTGSKANDNLSEVQKLKKKYPKLSNSEAEILSKNPDAILQGMYETSEEYLQARQQTHNDNHDRHLEGRI